MTTAIPWDLLSEQYQKIDAYRKDILHMLNSDERRHHAGQELVSFLDNTLISNNTDNILASRIENRKLEAMSEPKYNANVSYDVMRGDWKYMCPNILRSGVNCNKNSLHKEAAHFMR